MGCFNGTCGVSGMPIRHGDRIVAYMISVPNKPFRPDGYCYPDDYAYPICLPFRGSYNDYGGIEEIDLKDPTLPITAKLLGLDLKNFEEDLKEKLDEGAYEERGSIKVKMGFRDEVRASLWFCHERIHDAFAKDNDSKHWYTDEPMRDIYERMLPGVFDIIKKALLNKDKSPKSRGGLSDDPRLTYFQHNAGFEKYQGASKYDEEKPFEEENPIASLLYNDYGRNGRAMIDYYRGAICDLLETGKKAETELAKKVFWALINHNSFASAFGAMSRIWIPNCTKGHQEPFYEDHLKLINLMKDIMVEEYAEDFFEKDTVPWMESNGMSELVPAARDLALKMYGPQEDEEAEEPAGVA